MKYTTLILFMLFLLSCKDKKEHGIIELSPEYIVDNLTKLDSDYLLIDSLLTLENVIVLDNSIPLARIKRIIISEEKIYILDTETKIVCYNFDGNVEYSISSKGKGAGEYLEIGDFSIDKNKAILYLYDNKLHKIMCYNLRTGKFSHYNKMIFYPPLNIASFGEYSYLHNPFVDNYPKSKEYHYNLFKIKGSNKIINRYFKHDPIISSYRFSEGKEFPFFYGNNELLYINRFDNIVYSIYDDNISPKFDIRLPNFAPYSYIRNKPDPMEFIKSDYSSGITNIYRAGNILHYNFTIKQKIISTFYDLSQGEVIYSGSMIPKSSKNLPVMSLIRGTIDNQFISIISPTEIIYQRKKNESLFPKKLQNVSQADNPIIAFYSINKNYVFKAND